MAAQLVETSTSGPEPSNSSTAILNIPLLLKTSSLGTDNRIALLIMPPHEFLDKPRPV